LFLMRAGVFVVGALAYVITVFGGQGLIALLLGAYGSIVQFAPGVYGALYSKKITGPAVITGLIVGTFVNYYYQLVAETTPFDIHAGILGLICNLIIVVAISAFSQQKSGKMAEEYRNIG
jgi:solute:Na+ symporter, SSS family